MDAGYGRWIFRKNIHGDGQDARTETRSCLRLSYCFNFEGWFGREIEDDQWQRLKDSNFLAFPASPPLAMYIVVVRRGCLAALPVPSLRCASSNGVRRATSVGGRRDRRGFGETEAIPVLNHVRL